MTIILRLHCDRLLGGRIDRETPTGMVTVATVRRSGDGLSVHLRQDPASVGLDHLEGLHAKDCNDLLGEIARSDVTVTMPNV
jgi:hypothetical protein